MEKYQVSARKYRPSTFDSVVGQQALTTTLKNAVQSGRLAHAYLFCGPRGVGKTTCARIFAKTINCEHPTADGEACNECESCRAFNEQRSYNVSELDAASNNGVDEMRNLVEQVKIPPQTGKYKVYIIDEVHMLSASAFNAFLKTLEEPPSYAIFVLATTEKHKIIPTILSRCQTYDFSRITVKDIIYQLQKIAKEEGITTTPEALNIIAQKADGGMRDALSIFDQVTASSGGNITYQAAIDNLNVLDYDYYFRLTDDITAGNVPATLITFQEIRNKGFDAQFFINGLASHFRNLVAAYTPETLRLLEMADEVIPRYQQQAAKTPLWFLYKAMDLCNECDIQYRTALNKQFVVELTLIKLCQLLNPTPPPKELQSNPMGGNNGLKPIVNNTPQTAGASAPANAVANNASIVSETPSPYVATAKTTLQRPVQQPKSETSRTATPGRISISSLGGAKSAAGSQPSQHTEAPVTHRVELKEPFDEDKFRNISAQYALNFPNEAFLINALSNASVEIGSD
ncbi:MAG: DNA polymerase III subunit gamma/tau, partial [Muribaculaceae bacterium]|nr:DNA polymerase III subunit gamma/tau [Muribaculaceae bacterium]